MKKSLLGLVAVAALATAPAHAAIDSYFAVLFGANEVAPNVGDPDGFGTATVLIDNVANKVSWSFLALNIDLPLAGSHIHQGDVNTNGPIKIDFASTLSGNGLLDADLALITPATASGFYVNLHNSVHPRGAIRGQLSYITTVTQPIPEPGTYALMLSGLGAVGLIARRRKA